MESLAVIFSSHAPPVRNEGCGPNKKFRQWIIVRRSAMMWQSSFFTQRGRATFCFFETFTKLCLQKRHICTKKTKLCCKQINWIKGHALLRVISSEEGNNKKHYIFSGNGNIIHTRCGAVVYGAYTIYSRIGFIVNIVLLPLCRDPIIRITKRREG